MTFPLRRALCAALLHVLIVALYVTPVLLPCLAAVAHAFEHRILEAQRRYQSQKLGALYHPSMDAGAHWHADGTAHPHQPTADHSGTIAALLAAADTLPEDERSPLPVPVWLTAHLPAPMVALAEPPGATLEDCRPSCLARSGTRPTPLTPPARRNPEAPSPA